MANSIKEAAEKRRGTEYRGCTKRIAPKREEGNVCNREGGGRRRRRPRRTTTDATTTDDDSSSMEEGGGCVAGIPAYPPPARAMS
eukprot:6996496-Pyramimonas_sp.AAC.1